MESIRQEEATKGRSLKITENPQGAHIYKRIKQIRIKINYQLQDSHFFNLIHYTGIRT